MTMMRYIAGAAGVMVGWLFIAAGVGIAVGRAFRGPRLCGADNPDGEDTLTYEDALAAFDAHPAPQEPDYLDGGRRG